LKFAVYWKFATFLLPTFLIHDTAVRFVFFSKYLFSSPHLMTYCTVWRSYVAFLLYLVNGKFFLSS